MSDSVALQVVIEATAEVVAANPDAAPCDVTTEKE